MHSLQFVLYISLLYLFYKTQTAICMSSPECFVTNECAVVLVGCELWTFSRRSLKLQRSCAELLKASFQLKRFLSCVVAMDTCEATFDLCRRTRLATNVSNSCKTWALFKVLLRWSQRLLPVANLKPYGRWSSEFFIQTSLCIAWSSLTSVQDMAALIK